MTRTSPPTALTISTMAMILILNYVVQPATSFVLISPRPISISNTIQSCFHRSPLLACGSHIIHRSMSPLHFMVEENVDEKNILESAVVLPTQDRNGIYDISTKEDHL